MDGRGVAPAPVMTRSEAVDLEASASASTPDQTLTCLLCRGHLRQARVLPACLHSFCLPCLETFVGDNKTFNCPTCKTVSHTIHLIRISQLDT